MHSLAVLTMDFPPGYGGVQKFLYEISRRLASSYEVCVVTPVRGDLGVANFQRHFIRSSSPWQYWKALKKLKPHRTLIGHAHPRILLAVILATRSNFALMTHGNDFLKAQNRWHKNIFNYMISQAKPLITNSAANAQRLRILGCENPFVVYPGTDPECFLPPDERLTSGPTLLSVGRLIPRKGLDLVIETLPKLLMRYPDIRYKIVGEGPDRSRLEQLVLDFGVEDIVDFLGYVENDDLPLIYQNADIFVLPAREVMGSSIEGFGIVFLEASACGLPVVAGRSGGAVEAVLEGETGILVDPNNSEILGDSLIELLDHPEKRARMGRAGREWVVNRMNWDRAASEIHKLLEGN